MNDEKNDSEEKENPFSDSQEMFDDIFKEGLNEKTSAPVKKKPPSSVEVEDKAVKAPEEEESPFSGSQEMFDEIFKEGLDEKTSAPVKKKPPSSVVVEEKTLKAREKQKTVSAGAPGKSNREIPKKVQLPEKKTIKAQEPAQQKSKAAGKTAAPPKKKVVKQERPQEKSPIHRTPGFVSKQKKGQSSDNRDQFDSASKDKPRQKALAKAIHKPSTSNEGRNKAEKDPLKTGTKPARRPVRKKEKVIGKTPEQVKGAIKKRRPPSGEPAPVEKGDIPQNMESAVEDKPQKRSPIPKIALTVVLLAVMIVAVAYFFGILDFSDLSGPADSAKIESIPKTVKKEISQPPPIKSPDTEPLSKQEDEIQEEKPPVEEKSVAVEKKSAGVIPELLEKSEVLAERDKKISQEKPITTEATPRQETPPKIEQVLEIVEKSYPFSIYLGSHKKFEDILEVMSLYEEKGLSFHWVRLDLGDKGIWFRLFAGYFEKRWMADTYIKENKIEGAESRKTGYAVLIGRYQSEEELIKKRLSLTEQGYSYYIIPRDNGTLNPRVFRDRLRKGEVTVIAKPGSNTPPLATARFIQF